MQFWLVSLGVLIVLAAVLCPFGGWHLGVASRWPSATEHIDRRLLAAVGIGCLVGAMFL